MRKTVKNSLAAGAVGVLALGVATPAIATEPYKPVNRNASYDLDGRNSYTIEIVFDSRAGRNVPQKAAKDPRLQGVALSGNGLRLSTFNTNRPSAGGRASVQVTGLQTDARLIGIDYRVQNGLLYGVGNAGGVYTINRATGAATLVVRLSTALQGTSFGVDFNPAANALRVVSDTGQNLRQPFPATGTVFVGTATDTPLAFAPVAPATATVATGVTAAAYTNNDSDTSTATVLYDINVTTDQLVIQSPANAGSLAAVGGLGVDFQGDAGFDIYSVNEDGATESVLSYAVNRGRLYKINLVNGKAKELGVIGDGNVTDIAFPLDQF